MAVVAFQITSPWAMAIEKDGRHLCLAHMSSSRTPSVDWAELDAGSLLELVGRVHPGYKRTDRPNPSIAVRESVSVFPSRSERILLSAPGIRRSIAVQAARERFIGFLDGVKKDPSRSGRSAR